MTTIQRLPLARAAAALCLAIAATVPAQAQTSANSSSASGSTAGSGMRASAFGSDGYSLLPFTRSGYAGINLGKPDWRPGCTTGFDCDDADASVYIYTGGLINEVLGLELGYVNTGSAHRNGGSLRAQGVNLSLVARVPLGAFNVFAKAGGLYGQTKVSADPAAGITTGTERGWGATYAAGVGYDFNRQMGVVLEWARNEFRVPAGGRDDVDTLSLGLVRRF